MKAKRKFNTVGKCPVNSILRRSNLVFRSFKTLLAALVILTSLFIAACKSNGKADNSEAVAKVGSREITMKQVDSAIKQQLDQAGGNSLTPAELVAARLAALENLIQDEALFQRAQKENLVPDDNKVNQEIQRRKQQANLTEDQYQAQIKAAGLSEEEVREKIRRELAISALRDAQNARVAQPTTAEIEKYYGDHQSEFRAERGVDLAVIATDPQNNGAADDAIGDTQAETKIKRLYEQLRGGTDFATLASQASEDAQSALRGGSLGFATEDQLKQIFPSRPDLVGKLMTMSTGQYTEPIKDNGSNRWYIIKVNNKVEQPRNLSLDDVRANITNAITQQRQGILLNALMLNAVNEAGVKNYLAERIVQNPQIISEMKPSELLNQTPQNPAQPRPAPTAPPQPRFENQNQATANANRPAAGSGAANRPAAANANR
ncbi:MAG TPA: SurA N-terminal domain-containing protein [Blastocatellia bacterium]|nr:SurA N-terminal domain-containing protein [Blastocatellia bacterium]